MYPFERFNMDARRSLTLAQEEAERAHHSYIGTEHLQVNLLRKTLIEAQSALETAVRAQQVELAARLQHTVDSLLEELMKAEQEWLDALL
jgi:ATP-dependent Clp protease ATP-binding subunit ClpA